MVQRSGTHDVNQPLSPTHLQWKTICLWAKSLRHRVVRPVLVNPVITRIGTARTEREEMKGRLASLFTPLGETRGSGTGVTVVVRPHLTDLPRPFLLPTVDRAGHRRTYTHTCPFSGGRGYKEGRGAKRSLWASRRAPSRLNGTQRPRTRRRRRRSGEGARCRGAASHTCGPTLCHCRGFGGCVFVFVGMWRSVSIEKRRSIQQISSGKTARRDLSTPSLPSTRRPRLEGRRRKEAGESRRRVGVGEGRIGAEERRTGEHPVRVWASVGDVNR